MDESSKNREKRNFVSAATLLLIRGIINSNSPIFEGRLGRHKALLIYNLRWLNRVN